MTKARSIQPPQPKTIREGRMPKSIEPQPADACEMFLAELKARRERLQHLLSLVHQEAGRAYAAQPPVHPRHKCGGTRRRSSS